MEVPEKLNNFMCIFRFTNFCKAIEDFIPLGRCINYSGLMGIIGKSHKVFLSVYKRKMTIHKDDKDSKKNLPLLFCTVIILCVLIQDLTDPAVIHL